MSQINESAIKTPGVYVTEIPSFPPSIAQVATAIPVFVGYTEFATVNGQSAFMQAVEINSLVQYTTYFGEEPADQAVTVTLDKDTNSPLQVAITPPYQMYNAIRLFFAHGGGTCFILSVGAYKSSNDGKIIDFLPATTPTVFDIIQKEEDITLIVIPDAVILPRVDFNTLMTQALQLCATMEDRFTIMDVYAGDTNRTFDSNDVITLFRTGVGGSNLNYAAAYYPYLNTSLPSSFGYANISLQKSGGGGSTSMAALEPGNMAVKQIDNAVADQKKMTNFLNDSPDFYTGDFTFATGPAYWINSTTPRAIADAYAQIPVIGDKPDIKRRLEFMYMVLKAFVALDGTWADKPAAYSGVPAGATTQEIFSSYIQKGTNTSLSTIEQMMSKMLLIDTSFPDPIPAPTGTAALGQVHLGDFQPLSGSHSYLAGGAPAVDATIYNAPPGSSTTPGTVGQAVSDVLPAVQSLFNSLVNQLNSFANAITNRVNGLEIQVTGSSSIYTNIKNAIANAGVLVPPSGAIAGIYAAVDASRGVWKAPANVPLQYVIQPAVNIDAQMQEDLNIDTNAGKSVNAIRTFTGWGTLVWGARTLDGNSNDWRYIPVRRLFIMVEASVKNAAFTFVFEPNDSRTWTKVRAMIENYLTGLWKQGALAGAKPEQAFYVKVGLNQTMTFDDILNGRMIVEIGMAPVRPAEFIILRFTQMQQQS